MAHYSVKLSDGRTAQFDHPNAGLSKDEVQSIVQQQLGGQQRSSKPLPLGKTFDAVSSLTPWNITRSATTDALGEKTAELGGRMGYPKTGATVGTGIQMIPDILASIESPDVVKVTGVQGLRGVNAVLPKSETLGNIASEASFRTMGGGVGNVKEIGAEGARGLGRFGLENELVKFRTGPMRQALEQTNLNAGKKIEALRLQADINSPAPKMAEVIGEIKRRLGPKYSTGIESGGKSQLDNAIEELMKAQPMKKSTPGEVAISELEPSSPFGGMRPKEVNRRFSRELEKLPGFGKTSKEYQRFRTIQERGIPEYPTSEYNPTHSDYAEIATRLNSFAEKKGKLLQDSSAVTDVANVLSDINNQSLAKSLGPQKFAEYQKHLNDYSKTEQIKKLLINREAKEIGGREGPGSVVRNVIQATKDRMVNPFTAKTFNRLGKGKSSLEDLINRLVTK